MPSLKWLQRLIWFAVLTTGLSAITPDYTKWYRLQNTAKLVEVSHDDADREIADNKLLACYISPSRRLDPRQVPVNLCTHIIFAFGVISEQGIGPASPSDIQAFGYLTSLKKWNKSLKILLSIQKNFLSVVHTSNATLSRISSQIVDSLKKYHFDGLDLDWEYPKSSDKEAFSSFIQILSSHLHPAGLLLSIAIPNAPVYFKHGFDVDTINRYMNFTTAMAYDFHMYIMNKDNTTGYNSPLFTPKGEISFYSVEGLINYYLSEGIFANKLLLGVPTYGRSWTLADAQRFQLHSPATDIGPKAPFSGLRGLYIYADVCLAISMGAIPIWDNTSKAEFLHRDTTWVSYDNVQTLEAKVNFMKQMSLAGIGVWALHIDDAQGICSQGKFPLVSAIKKALS